MSETPGCQESPVFRVIVRCQLLDTWITPGPLPSSPGIQGDHSKGGKIGQDIPDTGGGLEGIRRQEREDGKYFPQLLLLDPAVKVSQDIS